MSERETKLEEGVNEIDRLIQAWSVSPKESDSAATVRVGSLVVSIRNITRKLKERTP